MPAPGPEGGGRGTVPAQLVLPLTEPPDLVRRYARGRKPAWMPWVTLSMIVLRGRGLASTEQPVDLVRRFAAR
ncbi:hypothetical protein H4W31_006504 [Plantactinospora soyae]|uniref:Uncharacterized protein n=1 Tax=Plantactinospora soyae TaxID=1544732 RepID=A0A927MD01_9ACTN|nr:hypothetical protein [Plantactinospora soyae]